MSLDGIGYRIACSVHFNTPWCSGFGLSDCWVKQKDYVASRLRRDLDTWRLRNNPLPTLSRITLVHMQLHSIQDVKICLVHCNTAIHHTVLSTYSRLLMQVKLYTYYLIQDFQNPFAVHRCASRIMASTCCPMSRAMSWWKSSPPPQVKHGWKWKHCEHHGPRNNDI